MALCKSENSVLKLRRCIEELVKVDDEALVDVDGETMGDVDIEVLGDVCQREE
jgi:hypothetical protein